MTVVSQAPFITLLDLPANRFKVKVNKQFSNKLFNLLKKKYNSLYKSAIYFRYKPQTVLSWSKTQQFPLDAIIKLCNNTEINLKNIQKNTIYIKSGYFKFGGNVSKPINPKFPIVLSKELVRVLAHLFGDGCLCLDKNNYLTGSYYNQSKELREQFKQDISIIFGYYDFKEGINKTTPYVSIPSPISLILLQIVKDFNSKKIKIPSFIKKSAKKFKKEFIRSFFDDEAHVRYKPPHRYIEIALCNLKLLKQIRVLLEEFYITPTKISYKKLKGFDIYYFYIRNYNNLKSFFDQINFNHPHKKEKLKKIIDNPGRKSFARGESKKIILNYLNQRKYTIPQLSKLLNRDSCTISYWLNILKKERKVKIAGFKKVTIHNQQKIWDLR